MGNAGSAVQGSAVQVSPYVFITAAHVVSDPAISPPLVIQVYPKDGMPSPVPPIYVGDYVVDPAYSSSDPNNSSHDIAFLHAPNPHNLASYPPIFKVNAAVDGPGVNQHWGNGSYDPYAFTQFGYFVQANCSLQANYTFYQGIVTAYGYCNGAFVQDVDNLAITEMGYPGTSTTPWYDSGNAIMAGNAYASAYQYIFQSAMYYPCSGCTGVISAWNATAYGGESGGPIFAGYNYSQSVGGTVTIKTAFVLLGIMTGSLPNTILNNGANSAHNIGLGWMSYNSTFFTSNKSWSPGSPAPYITGSPNPVTIPNGSTSAPYTMAWSAPNYANVSLYAINNLPPYNSQIYCLGTLAASGSLPENIYTGETAQLYITPNTGCIAGSTVTALPNPVLASTAVHSQ